MNLTPSSCSGCVKTLWASRACGFVPKGCCPDRAPLEGQECSETPRTCNGIPPFDREAGRIQTEGVFGRSAVCAWRFRREPERCALFLEVDPSMSSSRKTTNCSLPYKV